MDALFRFAFILLILDGTFWICSAQDSSWSEVIEACIKEHNDWTGVEGSFAACQRSCERQREFTCRSVDYKDGTCHHSSDNQNSATSDFSKPCYTGKPWQYAERVNKELTDSDWSTVVWACIKEHNDLTVHVESMAACQRSCEIQTRFICASVEFWKGECHQSSYNQTTFGGYFTKPCYTGGPWQFSERLDIEYRDVWSDTIAHGCIKENDDRAIHQSNSLATCQKSCIDETEFVCASIDYNSGKRLCNLSRFNREHLPSSSDWKQPCHVAGWSYTERVVSGEWTQPVEGCMIGYNIMEINVPNYDSCRLFCIQNDDCCSINYNMENKICELNNRKKAGISGNFFQPCNRPVYYSEISDKSCD